MKRILLLAISLCGAVAFAQMPEVDYPNAKLIAKRDYENAEKKIVKDYQGDTNDVIVCYAYFRLLSEKYYTKHDYFKAFALITHAYQLYNSLDKKKQNKLLKKNITQERLLYDIREASELWLQNAIASNDIKSLETYLTICTTATDSQRQRAIKKVSFLEFNAAKSINTVNAYQAFIDKWPEAEEVWNAIQLRNSAAYVVAAKTNTIDAYQEFIRRYPDAKEVADATANIHRIAYTQTETVNTIEAYLSFVAKYPTAAEVEVAKLKIKELEKESRCVTLVVSADGATKTDAINNALRSAIEQTFGTFVSANTEILNDQLVKDEIVTVSSGNIQTYSEIATVNLPDGNTSVTLDVTVSISKLITYAQSKGAQCEFAGATFGANYRMYEFNKKNERIAIQNMIRQLDALRPIYDYDITVSDPRLNDDNRTATVEIAVVAKQTEKSKIFNNIVINTFNSLAKHSYEIEPLEKAGFKFYQYIVDIIGREGSKKNIYLYNDDLLENFGFLFYDALYDYAITDNSNGVFFKLFVYDTFDIKTANGHGRPITEYARVRGVIYPSGKTIARQWPNRFSLIIDDIHLCAMTFKIPIQDLQKINEIKITPTKEKATCIIKPTISARYESAVRYLDALSFAVDVPDFINKPLYYSHHDFIGDIVSFTWHNLGSAIGMYLCSRDLSMHNAILEEINYSRTKY
jgi:hypothetical protein